MGGQVARASRLVTGPECGPLTKRCRVLNEASVASPLATRGIPANEADILGDRSGESLWIVATVLLESIQKEVRHEMNASR